MPNPANHAVFLSYASQDEAAAQRICEALRAAGVEVWFDREALVGGDAWDQNIRGQVGACALFIPVISANTQERQEGYFRLEWHLAEQRSLLIAKGRPFIVPVSIDATSERGALVPEAFTAVQWTKLPGGETPPAFVARVQKLLGGPSAPSATIAPLPPAPTDAPASRTGPPRWAGLALGVVVVALIGFLVMRPGAKDVGPAAQPVPEAKSSPVAAPAAGPVVYDKSIAVLPFTNLSDEQENTAFFADGMHEDILTNLANISELRVVSRTSVMEYRNTTKKIPQIARELGVAYILEGSVRRSGNQVRITGQLIRAANDEHLWAKSYDRELTPKEIFGIQAALSIEIAGALKTAISPETKKLLERRPTENLAAYELFLRARQINSSIASDPQHAKEISLYQSAVKLDPEFSAAWAELATSYGLVYRNSMSPEALAQAKAALREVTRLEIPDSPVRLSAEANYAFRVEYDLPRAEAQFRQLIRIQPNELALIGLAVVQSRQGNWAAAIPNFRLATQLDPRNKSGLNQLLRVLLDVRRYEESIGVQRQILELDSTSLSGAFNLAELSFVATGSHAEMEQLLARLPPAQTDADSRQLALQWAFDSGNLAEFQRLYALPTVPTEDLIGGLGFSRSRFVGLSRGTIAMAAAGDIESVRRRAEADLTDLRTRVKQQPENTTPLYQLSYLAALVGEKDEAVRCAQRIVELWPLSTDARRGAEALVNLALVWAWTGEKDRAIAELAKILRKPGSGLHVHLLKNSFEWKPLQGDPRFEALLNDPKNNAPLF